MNIQRWCFLEILAGAVYEETCLADKEVTHRPSKIFIELGRFTVNFPHYRVVQLDFTQEIKISHMLFDRYHCKHRGSSVKQHMKYYNFLCKIQLDYPVCDRVGYAVPSYVHKEI